MISALELRHIIESGLLPRSCTCTVNPRGALLIKLIEPTSGHVELFVPGVLASALTSSRAISNLIGELRIEMAARKKICVGAGGVMVDSQHQSHQVTSTQVLRMG